MNDGAVANGDVLSDYHLRIDHAISANLATRPNKNVGKDHCSITDLCIGSNVGKVVNGDVIANLCPQLYYSFTAYGSGVDDLSLEIPQDNSKGLASVIDDDAVYL